MESFEKIMQIIGLGLATLDIVMRLKELPTWQKPVGMDDLLFDGGGPVGTAVAAAARLGAQVGFVGTCGSDEIASLKMRTLTCEGIDTSRVKVRPGPEREVVVVYVQSATGERIFSASAEFRRDLLQPDELDYDYITSAEYLHLDGFHIQAALQAARWMHAAGKKVVMDAAKTSGGVNESFRQLVALSDYLICGSGFTQSLTGEPERLKAGRAALGCGPSVVVQTEGEEGCYTFTAGSQFHTPAFKVEVRDTTGAGDVFHGAYLVGLLHNFSLERVAAFASAAAAIKCTALGGRAGIPHFEDVEQFLASRSII
jgi:sulfofructose kinase